MARKNKSFGPGFTLGARQQRPRRLVAFLCRPSVILVAAMIGAVLEILA